MTTSTVRNPGERYEEISKAGADATRKGDFRKALEAYRKARKIADSLPPGDPSRTDRQDASDLNIAMVLIQAGRAREGAEGLREILLRSNSHEISFSAAYNLAASLRKQGRHDRARRYAARAMEYAGRLGSIDRLAVSHALLGNILLSQNYVDEALAQYNLSAGFREQQQGDTRYSRAILLENIGYCLLMKEDLRGGLDRIQEALALANQVGDRRCRAECLQDLCYGLLLLGDYPRALEHGCEALGLARRYEFSDIEENCHYLLGELGNRTRDFESRDEHFARLQQMHPELPFLKDFLCAVDVTSILSLKR